MNKDSGLQLEWHSEAPSEQSGERESL